MSKTRRLVIVMTKDRETLIQLGARIKALRKAKGWTQKELANMVDVRYPQLNKYESGLHAPPVEKLVLLADALETSVDFLLAGDSRDNIPLHNQRLIARLRELESCKHDDLETIINVIDAIIVKSRTEKVLQPIE